MTTFEIACALEYAVNGPTEFVFNVQAADTSQQRIQRESLAIEGIPGFTEHVEPLMGNRYVRGHAEAGPVRLHYRTSLTVMQVAADPGGVPERSVAELPVETLPFIMPSRYCPSDTAFDLALREFGHLPRGHQRVEAVCDWVHARMRFTPGSTNWNTSALDALHQGAGVCRDFAHVTITLLRALNIPARFVTGYDYGVDPSYGPTDFHAYVEAYLGDRWWIFDATRLAPRNGLVRIGTGRDAADCAFSTLFGPARFVGMSIDIQPLGGPVIDDRAFALSTAGFDDNLRWRGPRARETNFRVAA
jgi:transglutaminase-like putative cysteine protease